MFKNTGERRHHSDALVRWINYFSAGSWILLIGAFAFFSFAQPARKTFFDTYFQSTYAFAQRWNSTYLDYAMILLLFIIMVCIIGLGLNSMRHKRRSDKYRFSLIFNALVSAVILGIIFLFLR